MKIHHIKSTLILIGLAFVTMHSSLKADILFQDDFNGSINPAWQIVREDGAYFTVNPTELDLRASSGDVFGDMHDAKNIFLISNPASGDFVVTLRLNSFVPVSNNYAQINLIAYDDDDNLVRNIYGHVFGGRYLGLGKAAAGVWSDDYTPANFGSDAFYLRLTKEGNVYTQSYSMDGITFHNVNTPVTYGDGMPAYLGFNASFDPSENSHAYIDSFTVTGTVPEPSVYALLMGTGTLAFAFARRRSRPDAGRASSAQPENTVMKTHHIKSTLILIGLAFVTMHASLKADILFQDDFNGSINPAWQIVREDGGYFTVNPTELDLRASSGDVYGGMNNAKNIFLISNPASGDFVVTLRLNSFVPANNDYAQIDLVAYDDDDNLVRNIYGHIFGGRNLEFGQETAGYWSTEHTLADFSSGAFYLRLTKEGNVYTQSYSTDGITFHNANNPVTYGDGTPAYLGFNASCDPSESSHAYIDSFTVTGTVPEPSVCALLMGTGTLAFAFARRRRRQRPLA